ncbi:SDR family oxidoreductase [Williamsia muralis]|uniref:SDR family oxidoreductase n=1 Tax=Williamsia marianensis TaxID=85044 RepID=UPI000DE6843B|nr:SDR family oxidoreductase [Williamsia marianensis]PVY29368.1 short-subunit dehydrogenase [Williamsia marianensis]
MNVRTALVTGASSGIGQATAERLVAEGFRVYGTSRNPAEIPDSARIEGVRYVRLELGSVDSAQQCIAEVGAVDVLINNAGESQNGPLEDLPMDAIERLFTINVLAPVRLTQLVLPGMRQRGYGRVVMVGSMLASFPLAYRSSYVASKAALKAFSTAARGEVAPFGVGFITVEPGSINTGISERRTKYIADDSVYRPAFERVLDALDRNEKRGIPAERVAQTIVSAVQHRRPRSFYAVGSRAPLAFAARRALTEGGVNRLSNWSHGLRR